MGGRIKGMLALGRLVRVFSMGQFVGPKVVEVTALQGGFDAFWIDHEHSGVSLEAVENTARAVRAAGLDSFVRMAATDYASVMRFLEVGAGGIMAAQVETPDEAERVVRWAKFAPRGRRGVNGGNLDGDYGLIPLADYAARSNRETFVAIQIENAEALANVEEIARVPDVDLLFIGPADLSQALDVTGQFDHPRCLSAVERIAEACAAAGVAWGTVAVRPDYARRMVERGCRMLELASDVGLLRRGLQATQAIFEEYFAPEPAPLTAGSLSQSGPDGRPGQILR
jgi:2-dehydro-3-deoxyglucarate aldolase/4-hydroxy-2-oxoheptanedioate aldolase